MIGAHRPREAALAVQGVKPCLEITVVGRKDCLATVQVIEHRRLAEPVVYRAWKYVIEREIGC